MDVIKEWTVAENEELGRLEEVFLKRVRDDEIRRAYMAARKGDAGALRTLDVIAHDLEDDDQMSARQAHAQMAMEIVRWFRMATY